MLYRIRLILLDWPGTWAIALLLLFLSRYDWCGDTPFEAQRITSALMTMNPRAFILSEIGTGKTRAALYAIDFLMREGLLNRPS